MNPKVSIVMPVYNASRYLPEAVGSVLGQSYRNLELICVDDGSTDGSVDMLREYAAKDERLTVLQQQNQYAGIARNNGMAHATGDYIMFLDSDDVFERNMLSYLVKKAEKYDPQIIIFGYSRFADSVKRHRPVRNKYKDGTICGAEDIRESIFQITRSLPWDKFINRAYLEKTGLKYQGTRVNNDIFFNRSLVTTADRILFCTKRLVNYRVNNNSSLQGKLNKSPTDFLRGNMGIYRELCARGSIETFRRSYEKMLLDDIAFHLLRVRRNAEFTAICTAIQECDLFSETGIDADSASLKEHPYRDTFLALMQGDLQECMTQLFVNYHDRSILKDSVEYRVGRSIIDKLGISI